MEFIDKTKGDQRAHLLLKGFLDRCLNMTPYPADLYEAMKHDVEPDVTINPLQKHTYNLLLEWILEETHISDNLNSDEGYCCYCMRKIKANEAHSTLEHIIPKSIDNEVPYSNYFDVPSELEKDEHIMAMKTIFLNKYHKQALPCPHNAAYENLVASCDGSLPKGSSNHVCCNGPRGAKKIPPMMFMKNIHDEIKYKTSGYVVWKDNSYIDKRERAKIINDVLCLNNDILRMVRKIWYFLCKEGKNCLTADRRQVIDTLRPQCIGEEKNILQNFYQDNYWYLLQDYTYFNDISKFTI